MWLCGRALVLVPTLARQNRKAALYVKGTLSGSDTHSISVKKLFFFLAIVVSDFSVVLELPEIPNVKFEM